MRELQTAERTRGRAARAAGRPRDPAIDRAILEATIDMLAEEGYDGMSIEAVAERAGVGKPTIYRRWPSKQAMVIEALGGLNDRPEVPDEGTVRERLTVFMEQWWGLAAGAERTNRSRLFSCLVGQIGVNPELRDAVQRTFVANRRRKIQGLLREGIESGELRTDLDVELATDLLFGALLVRRLITRGRVGASIGRRIVDVLFDGYGARA